MKVRLPITHIEEIDIPDEVFWKYIKERFQETYRDYKIGSYIDSDGNLKAPYGYDGFSYSYRNTEKTPEMLAIHGLWEQISQLYDPEEIKRREKNRKGYPY